MTRTTPLRLTILHLAQRFFTDALTFIGIPPLYLILLIICRGQDLRTVLCNHYGMLEMSRV